MQSASVRSSSSSRAPVASLADEEGFVRYARLLIDGAQAQACATAQRKILACSLLREPHRGADTGLEDGVGLGAVGGRTRELQRPGEESQERRCVGAGHLVASV